MTSSGSDGDEPLEDSKKKEVETTQMKVTGSTGISDRDDLIPGFRLVDKLGEGGMGVVYKATQLSLNRTVAIKVMKTMGNEDDTEFTARFKREAIAAAKLNHPNIVGIHDHGSAHGTVYMVLEFIEGLDCGDMLRDHGAFDEREAMILIRGVVLGLAHAAKQGVIHRDIKPANIMVVKHDHDDPSGASVGVAKLTDFGIAALRQKKRDPQMTELTQKGTIIGTPGYMSPEQSMGKDVDFRSDIYSLGCTLYYLMTAAPPYSGETAIEVFHNKMTQQIPNPRDLRQGISPGAVQVVCRMMAREVDDRYSDYADLVNDIDRVLAGERPQAADIPPRSQSIAQAGGSDIDDEATALASTAATPPPGYDPHRTMQTPAPGRPAKAAPKQGNGFAVKLLGAVALLLVLGVGAFFVFGGEDKGGGDSEIDPTNSPNVKTGDVDVDALRSFVQAQVDRSDDELLLDSTSMKERFDELSAKVSSVKERSASDKELKKRVRAALGNTATARRDNLRALQSDRNWTTFVEEANKTKNLYSFWSLAMPGTISNLVKLVPDVSTKGDAEKADWDKIFVEVDTEKQRGLILAYLNNYRSFSPKKIELDRALDQLPKASTALEECKALIKEIDDIENDRDFIADSPSLEVTIKKKIEEIGGSDGRRLDRQLRGALRARQDSILKERLVGVRKHWKELRYAEFGRSFEEFDELMKSFKHGGRPRDYNKTHLAYADIIEKKLGVEERKIVAEVNASNDPLMIAKRLDRFERKFWFSPDLEAMQAKVAEAMKQVAFVEVVSTPTGAGIKVGNIDQGKTPFKDIVLKGMIDIELERAGYFPAMRSFDVQDATKIKIPLFPMPRTTLTAKSLHNLPLLPPRRVVKTAPEWSAIGASFAEIPAEAAFRLSAPASTGTFGVATLPLKEFLAFRSMKRAKGWRITTTVKRMSGTAEFRIHSNKDRSVVLRLRDEDICIGDRNKTRENWTACHGYSSKAGQGLPLSFEWHGDVMVVRASTARDSDKIIGSVRPSMRFGETPSISLAIKEGEVVFGDLKIWTLEP